MHGAAWSTMQRTRRSAFRSRRVFAAPVLLALGLLATAPARADNGWDLSVLAEVGSPGGWVQVREGDIQGTRLGIGNDLDINRMTTLRLRAIRSYSDLDEVHLGLATSTLDGSAMIDTPVNFNGATIAPGRLDTVTHFQDFLALDASYWRRLVGFDNGGGIWGSVGAIFELLNFRLQGTLAADSVGNELKEDFYVQELPVPTLGLHLRYPFGEQWKLTADASAGRLPWVDSFRTEGGEVRLAQTNEDLSLGVEYRFDAQWRAGIYAFHSYFAQNERSNEDGNAIHLTSNGVGIGLGYTF